MWRQLASPAAALGVVFALLGGAPAAATPPTVTASHPDLPRIATSLKEQLGDRSAGTYLDETTGNLTVTVTDKAAADTVRAAGAIPRIVTRSAAQLRQVTDALDRSARVPGTAWEIDPATNQVVVLLDETVAGARLTRVNTVTSQFGAAIRVERVPGTFRSHAPAAQDQHGTLANPVMEHGTAIHTQAGRCSLGFNVFPVGGGEHYFITAGHCTHAGDVWYADANLTSRLGANSGSAGIYGLGGDFGFVHYDTQGIIVRPTVAGTGLGIFGWSDPVDGQQIKRSGAKTGVRNGEVRALGVTVTYTDGVTLTDMIRATACAESGDSGGPMFRLTNGGRTAEAHGILSGSTGNCSAGGMSFYQPITPIMRDYALTMWDVR